MADRNVVGMVESSAPGEDVHDARRAFLERRLEDGYQRIDEASHAGADVTEWESFWIRLLGEYEDVCREMDIAA